MPSVPMPCSRSELFFAAGADIIPGTSIFNKFGYNPDVDTAAVEDVWTFGGTYVFPSNSGEAITITSNNAADNQTIAIIGLDENFAERTVQATLDGTNDVAVSGLWSRVNRALNTDSSEFAGTVLINDAATGLVVFSEILAADQQTNSTIFTIPAGKTGFVKFFSSSMNRSGGATSNAILRFKIRDFGSVFRTSVRFGLLKSGGSILTTENVVPGSIPGKSDIKLTAEVDANDSDISAFYSMVLIDDGDIR